MRLRSVTAGQIGARSRTPAASPRSWLLGAAHLPRVFTVVNGAHDHHQKEYALISVQRLVKESRYPEVPTSRLAGSK